MISERFSDDSLHYVCLFLLLAANASAATGYGTITYDLVGVISHIRDPIRPTPYGHVVLHVNCHQKGGERQWHSFNDVAVSKVELDEVLNFDRGWRKWLVGWLVGW